MYLMRLLHGQLFSVDCFYHHNKWPSLDCLMSSQKVYYLHSHLKYFFFINTTLQIY